MFFSQSGSFGIQCALSDVPTKSKYGHFCIFLDDVPIGRFIEPTILPFIVENLEYVSKIEMSHGILNLYLKFKERFLDIAKEILFTENFLKTDIDNHIINQLHERIIFLNWSEIFDGFFGLYINLEDRDLVIYSTNDRSKVINLQKGEFRQVIESFVDWYTKLS